MGDVINYKFSKLRLNTKDIIAEIGYLNVQRLREAGRFAAKTMRENVSKKGKSSPGGYPAYKTGRLKRAIGFRLCGSEWEAPYVIVGTKTGIAHLLEFGHGAGWERNKRPFVRPSLLEAEEKVVDIMSEKYW